jgi:tetratricopeptide (TPR) repeat protein
MMDNENTIRTLWHGSRLTIYEELSFRSFLKCGHRVEVYTYSDLAVPEGVEVCDARAILPPSKVFSYPDGIAKGSFAAFSNLFRFRLLHQKGGIWADSDVLCLRPLHDLPPAAVGRVDDKWLNGAILKFPPGHAICEQLAHKIESLGVGLNLGQTAGLLTRTVASNASLCNVLPVEAFYPVQSTETWRLIDPDELEYCNSIAKSSYCVHWWNAVLTMAIGLPKDLLPPVGSYIYSKAQEVFGTSDLRACPDDLAQECLKHQRMRWHAKQASAAKNWPEAVKLWTAVVDGFGDKATADMWVSLARAHRNNGDLSDASAVLEKAKARGAPKDSNQYRIDRERAEIATSKKQWSQAAGFWQQFIDMFPERVVANDYARLMRALRGKGELDAANAVGLTATARYPEDRAVAREFAELATTRKSWVQALERWKAVLNMYGSTAPARVYLRLSQALTEIGNLKAAGCLIQEAIEAKPDDLELNRELARLAKLQKSSGPSLIRG